MQLLIVAATEAEIAPLTTQLGASSATGASGPRTKTYANRGHRLDVLVTGVGMVATAAWCSRALSSARYDLALNFGVCGSFDPALPVLSAVHVVTDRFSEMGAEDDERFLSIQELKLTGENDFPFQDGRLVNSNPPVQLVGGLVSADGITVNTVHGTERSIAAAVTRFKPQIESMEGAAFMYACLIHNVPFAQVRVVSNRVEKRNRQAWKLAEAVKVLGETAWAMLGRA
jgi:futalosine hydrolase